MFSKVSERTFVDCVNFGVLLSDTPFCHCIPHVVRDSFLQEICNGILACLQAISFLRFLNLDCTECPRTTTGKNVRYMHRTPCVPMRMSKIELFDINSPLLPVGWRKWLTAPSAEGQLAMSRCIARQSFANPSARQARFPPRIFKLVGTASGGTPR